MVPAGSLLQSEEDHHRVVRTLWDGDTDRLSPWKKPRVGQSNTPTGEGDRLGQFIGDGYSQQDALSVPDAGALPQPCTAGSLASVVAGSCHHCSLLHLTFCFSFHVKPATQGLLNYCPLL